MRVVNPQSSHILLFTLSHSQNWKNRMLCYRSIMEFFVIAANELEMMVDLDTFYLNEQTTIQCSTSIKHNNGFRYFRLLLQSTPLERPNPWERTGCSYRSNGLWNKYDELWKQKVIPANYCAAAAQSTPFTITVQPTVTELLKGVDLWCYINAPLPPPIL